VSHAGLCTAGSHSCAAEADLPGCGNGVQVSVAAAGCKSDEEREAGATHSTKLHVLWAGGNERLV
jgi:hypothetical protein